MSGIVLVTPPDIPEDQLLFDEAETRRIFRFFWPHLTSAIDAMEINDTRRALAQRILVVGIDSSYALGFAQQLYGMLSPQRSFSGLAVMGGKLASHYMKHWWKHAKQEDLKKPRIAQAVRDQIALSYKSPAEDAIRDTSACPKLNPFYMASTMTTFWCEA